MKILSIVGARPQFIKAAVVSRSLRARRGWNELILHTGQHYDENMSRVFFDEMMIPRPDFQLESGSGAHGKQTASMLVGIEQVLQRTSPDWVILYGDTNSTLAGALAAAKLHIPIVHVEAGLRSFNRRMPEEINRVLTDHAADLLLAPSTAAVDNLRREGIDDSRIRLVGDVMCDAVQLFSGKAAEKSQILNRLQIGNKNYLLVTIHRAENTDSSDRLRAIFRGILDASKLLPVILPLHPRTRKALQNEPIWSEVVASLNLLAPVGYLDMLHLMSEARLVVTDSGGVQKEAFFCRTPCVTLRDETEWTELVEIGWNKLLSPSSGSDIGAELIQLLDKPKPPYPCVNPYGDGRSCERVVSAIEGAQRLIQMPNGIRPDSTVRRLPESLHEQIRSAVA